MHWQDITCVQEWRHCEKALKVSNNVVPIIEQIRSNHEEAATHMLLTGPDKAQTGLFVLWQVQILMCLFYLYIILVAWVYVKFSLIQEGKVHVYPCTKKYCRITFFDILLL